MTFDYFRGMCGRMALSVVLAICTSAANSATCERPLIYFVNGVWNEDWQDVENAAKVLTGALKSEASLLPSVDYGRDGAKFANFFFNPGDGYVEDVLEVFGAQKTAGATLSVALVLANATFIDSLRKSATAIKELDALVVRLAGNITRGIDGGRSIVLVAHSQGNILVNRAVEMVLKAHPEYYGLISVVGIGVADTVKAGRNYRYVTNSRDKIIIPLPGALPNNFNVEGTIFNWDGLGGLFGHLFTNTYLSSTALGYFNQEASQRSLRNVVASLTKDALKDVNCISTKLTPLDPPNTVIIGAQTTFKFTLTPGVVQSGRKPSGELSILNGLGQTICFAPVNGDTTTITCDTKDWGEPRYDTLTVKFVGSLGYMNSTATIPVQYRDSVCVQSQNYPQPGGTSNRWQVTLTCYESAEEAAQYAGRFPASCKFTQDFFEFAGRYYQYIRGIAIGPDPFVNGGCQYSENIGFIYSTKRTLESGEVVPNYDTVGTRKITYNPREISSLGVDFEAGRSTGSKETYDDLNAVVRQSIIYCYFNTTPPDYFVTEMGVRAGSVPIEQCVTLEKVLAFASLAHKDLPLIKRYGFFP